MSSVINEGSVSRGAAGRQTADFTLDIDDQKASELYATFDSVGPLEQKQYRSALRNWAETKAAEAQRANYDELTGMYADIDGWWDSVGGANVAADVKHGTANRKFIAHQLGTTPRELGDLYQTNRDQWFLKNYGQAPKSESEAFKTIGGLLSAQKQADETLVASGGQVALAAWEGKDPIAAVPAIVQAIKDSNPEIAASLPQGAEAAWIKTLYDETKKSAAVLQKHGETARQLYDLMVQRTGADVENAKPITQEDADALIDKLGELPDEDLDTVFTAIVAAAKASGMDEKGFWQQLGEANFSRFFNIFRGGGAQEPAAYDRLKYLETTEQPMRPATEEEQATNQGDPRFAQSRFGAMDRMAPMVPMSPEERQEAIVQARKDLRRAEMYNKLLDLADNKFDPIQKKFSGLAGLAESFAYYGPQALMTSVATRIPAGIGPALMTYGIWQSEYRSMRQQGYDVEQARELATFSAPLQMMVEYISGGILLGKNKSVEAFLAKMANPAKTGALKRFGVRVGVNWPVEVGEESVQQFTTAGIQQTLSALGEEYPDVDWEAAWTQYWNELPEIAAIALFPVLTAGGVITFVSDPRSEKTRIENYRMGGMSEQDITEIRDSDTVEQEVEKFRDKFWELDSARAARGRAYIASKIEERNRSQGPTVDIEVGKNGQPTTFIVRAPDGQVLLRTNDQSAADQVLVEEGRRTVQAQLDERRMVLREVVEQWESEDTNNVARVGQTATAQEVLERLQAVNNVEQIAVLHRRIAQNPQTANKPYDQILILGEATIEEVGEMVYRGIITLNDTSRPEDAREEIHHVAVRRAVATGRVTLDQLRGWLAATEPVLNQPLPRETQDDIVESLAIVQRAYEDGAIDAGMETRLPPSFIDYIKRMIAAFAEVMERAVTLREAFRSGALSGDYEAFLAETTGVGEQTVVDRSREKTAQEVAPEVANYSIALNPSVERALQGVSVGVVPASLVAVPESKPVPEGMMRRFHVTDLSMVPEILQSGLMWERGRGIEGPKALYSWADYQSAYSYAHSLSPDWNVAIVEHYADPNDYRDNPIATRNNVPPSQFLAIHTPATDAMFTSLNSITTQDSFDYLRNIASTNDGLRQQSQSYADALDAVLEVGKQLDAAGGLQNYSIAITPQQDADYLAAVERGDMETAQRMVDEAARAAGYNYGPLFHSRLTPFNAFEKYGKFMGASGVSGIHLTDSAQMAQRYLDRYGKIGFVDGKPYQPFQKEVIRVYAKINNPLRRQEPFETNLGLGAPIPQNYQSPVERMGYDALIRDEAISQKGTVSHSQAKNAIRGTEIILTDPNKIKSADPVTRDSQGNVIPLSQRFDATTANINYSIGTPDKDGVVRESDDTTEAGTLAPDTDLTTLDPDQQQGEDWQDIPWEQSEKNYSIAPAVLPEAFPVLDKALYDQILAETDTTAAIHIDRLRVGEYEGVMLQGGMYFPAIVENLKQGVVWAFNSKGVASAVAERARANGGYVKLVLMLEGNVIGNKTFATIWFKQLRKNIKAGKITTEQALAEINAIRERYVTRPVKGVTTKFTGHDKPFTTLKQAEKALMEMPQIKRGNSYFKKTSVVTKSDGEKISYQSLLSQAMTAKGFPDALKIVESIEEPAFKGLPKGTIVGLIKIDADAVPMTAAEAGVTEHISYGYVLKGKPVARMAKHQSIDALYPQISGKLMSQQAMDFPASQVLNYSIASGGENQPRAARGGQFGPNGEWYPAGSFIARTDRPKRERMRYEKKLNPKVQIAPFEWVQREAGMISPYSNLVGTFMDRDGNVMEAAMSAQQISGDRDQQIRNAAQRFKDGDRWLPINEFLHIANSNDVVAALKAGVPVDAQVAQIHPWAQDILDAYGATQNYSISTQSEIDRVGAALNRLKRSPSERITQYAALKERLTAALERNRPIMQSMRGDMLPQDFDRTRILNDLGFLDYILKVLPPEVRGRVGGYTNLASIAPVDVYKGDQKVSEAKNPAGAIISAWMREGLNIGQAQKKTELPDGYSTVPNTTDERRDKTFANFLIDRLKKIDRELERYYKRDLMQRIFDVLDKSRPKAGESGVKRSTLGPETQKFADMVYRASLLDDVKTPKRLAQIEAEITSIVPKDGDPESVAQSQKEISELSEEWTIVNTFGDLKNRSSETLASGLEWLQSQLKAGRESWRIKEAARIQENRERAAKVIAYLGKPTDVGRFENKSRLQRFLQAANAIDLDHKSFEQFAFWLFGDEVAAELSEKMMRANINVAKTELEHNRAILAALREGAKAAGTTRGKALAAFKENQSNAVRKLEGRKVKPVKISIELAKKIVRGLADRGSLSNQDVQTLADELASLPRDTKKENVTIQQVIFRGEEVRLTLSKAQAMQLWLTWQQTDAQEKMRKDGFNEDSIADIEDLLADPFSQTILRFMRRTYGSGYGITNPIYARMFGMNMPMVRNYAPARYLSDKEVKDVSLDGSPLTAGGQPSFAKSRVSHSAKLAPEDALTVLQGHLAMQAHFVAFAELHREYRSLLSNPEVRQAIRQQYGDDVLQTAEMWGDQMEQRGGNKAREIKWLQWLMGTIIGGQSVSLLGLNLKSLAMQSDNFGRFYLALNSRQIGSALSDPVALMRSIRKVWKTDILQTRIEGGATAETRFFFERFVSMFRRGTKVAELSMVPMNYTDSAGLSVSGAIVYQAAYKDAIESGMNEQSAEQAAKDAVEAMIYRYGQPVLMGQKSNIENSGNVFTKSFFLFMSDPRLKMAIISDAVRGLATGRGDWKTHVRRIVAVELMAVVSHVLATYFRDLTSDDEDEDLWSVGGFGRALLLAPFQGYFLLGTATELLLSRLMEGKWFTPTQNPLVRVADTGLRAFSNLDDALNFDDPDALVKEWTNITRTIAVAPPLAAPAVIMNLVRPLVQGWEYMDDDE